MHPLTLSKPKQLIEANGKPIIEHIISALPEEITEVILVVGYKGEMIIQHCGENYCGREMKYVWQHEALGTAHALEQAKDLLHDSFLLMYGDDLVDGNAIQKALQHKCCLLVFEHPDPRAFGVIELKEDGTLKSIVEKPENPSTNLVSASGMILHTDLFNYYGEWPDNGERFITLALNRYAQENSVTIEKLSFWYPMNSLEQLEEAERILKEQNI